MVNIERIRVSFSGFIGGPGVATFYALDAAASLTRMQTFWNSVKASMPTDFHIQVEAYGDIIDPTDGSLQGGWTGTAQTALVGADGAAYPAPAGAIVRWVTDTVVDNHRLQGRTFLVPLGGGSYQTDGSINSTNVGTLSSYAFDLATGEDGNLVVWHRPRLAKAADGSRPAVSARAGSYGPITGGGLIDKVVILRSRRD